MNLESLETMPMIEKPLSKSEDKKKKKGKGEVFRSFNKRKMKKPSAVGVYFLRNNGKIEQKEIETKHGFFNIEGKTYHEDADCIFRNKEGYPIAIIPEWSLVPYGTRKWHDKSMLEKFAELQDHALRGIRHAELVKMGERDGPKISGKAIVGFIILAIIGMVLVSSYI